MMGYHAQLTKAALGAARNAGSHDEKIEHLNLAAQYVTLSERERSVDIGVARTSIYALAIFAQPSASLPPAQGHSTTWPTHGHALKGRAIAGDSATLAR